MKINDQITNTIEKKKHDWKIATYYKYKQIHETYIYKYFEHIEIEQIDQEIINDFFESLEVSNNTKILIRRVLQFGIPKNMKLSYRIERNQNDIDVLTTKEQKQLERYLMDHITMINIGFLICLYSGLRLGEICALKWEDMNLAQQYIKVQKTIQRLPSTASNKKTKLTIYSPKTSQSKRRVPIPSFIIELLIQNQINPDFYVLSNHLKPMDPRSYQYHFKQVLKNAKIRNLNFHALRHTFATRCIENNIDIKTVSEILGHSDISITIQYYVKSTFEFKLEQIEKLAKNIE